MMQRLTFSLPDFCRVSWTSEAAKNFWQPLVERGAEYLHRMELETVLSGQRPVGLITVPEAKVAAVRETCAKHRMELRPLYGFGFGTRYISDLADQHRGSSVQACLVGHAAAVAEAEAAYANRQSITLGARLGYPPCCTAFFAEVWDKQRFIDTSWKMAERHSASGDADSVDESAIDISAPPELNILLRWLGIRPVFHLPCSFTCQASVAVAREIVAVADHIGSSQEMASVYRMLRWPTQWSALHGIAEIETPILRISTRTDPTASKHTVRIRGDLDSIEHAARGNRFPFVEQKSRSRGGSARLDTKADVETVAEQWLYVDNGYRSLSDMERAFAVIADALLSRSPRSIGHLACRNGAFLGFIAKRNSDLTLSGVDSDTAKITRARELLPAHAARFRIARLDDPDLPAELLEMDAYVVMAGRLTELRIERAQALISVLRGKSKGVLLYAFDDWLKRGSLEEMAAKFGATLDSGGVTTEVAAARWLA